MVWFNCATAFRLILDDAAAYANVWVSIILEPSNAHVETDERAHRSNRTHSPNPTRSQLNAGVRFVGGMLQPENRMRGKCLDRIVMKPLIFAVCLVFAFGCLSAQTPSWQPSPGYTQVPIWPSTVPTGRHGSDVETTAAGGSLGAGRPWLQVRNLWLPALTVYSS